MVGRSLVHRFETSIPIFLVVWIAEFDVSLSLIGVIVALGYAPFGIGALPGGILANRFGPKRLIHLCLVAMSGSFLLLALVTWIYTIVVGLICWGSPRAFTGMALSAVLLVALDQYSWWQTSLKTPDIDN